MAIKKKMLPIYFGCVEIPGHYAFNKNLETVSRLNTHGNYLSSRDGKLSPRDINEKEGVYSWRLIGNRTIIAFWDRSIDTRFKSNSVFMFEGRLSKEEAIEAIIANFPTIFKRFNFKLVWEGVVRG